MWPPGKSAERRNHMKKLTLAIAVFAAAVVAAGSVTPTRSLAEPVGGRCLRQFRPTFLFRPAPRIAPFRRPTRFRTRPGWTQVPRHVVILCRTAWHSYFSIQRALWAATVLAELCLLAGCFVKDWSEVSVLRGVLIADVICSMVLMRPTSRVELFPGLSHLHTDHDRVSPGSGRGAL